MSTNLDIKNLKRVFVIRHGKYKDGSLISEGIEQMTAAAARLRQAIEEGSKVLLISSTLPRAMESARIISHPFGDLEVVESKLLRNDRYYDAVHVVPEIMDHVDDHGVVIVVTHYELLSGIINFFSNSLFGKKFPMEVPDNGKGFCIDLHSGLVSNS